MVQGSLPQEITRYLCLGFTPIPLKPRSKEPLVKWGNGWKPASEELGVWASRSGINWGVRCGSELAALDFDAADTFHSFLQTHPEAASWPRVKTGRGFHIWVKPKKPIRSQRINGLEIKCLGSYVVAPPSIHPSGVRYVFEVAPDGSLPEVDLKEVLGVGQMDSNSQPEQHESIQQAAPSDFALRYGKSHYPQSLCGRATKILTRSDGGIKHLLSLRCWKWHCPKCAPLLKRYWLRKMEGVSFRFILRLPSVEKPTAFLRRVGKPDYVHIIANGQSWLFLAGRDADKVWAEGDRAGYQLVAGDVAGAPTAHALRDCLEQSLCCEEKPLNTRRKVSHSRGLFKRLAQNNKYDESNEKIDCSRESGHMSGPEEKQCPRWNTEVLMKPIEEVAKELEAQGWSILWRSEVEAIAIKGNPSGKRNLDIVELMENIGVKLKKAGKEYKGLCPFHDERDPSLYVNREKGLWHCFGCGRGGDSHRFVEEWQALRGGKAVSQAHGLHQAAPL